MIIASTRVHAISKTSDAKPVRPRTTAASQTGSICATGSAAVRDFARFETVRLARLSATASAPASFRTNQSTSAITLAAVLDAAPIRIAPDTPTAGISTNPATSAPTAAPAVFAAYSAPAESVVDELPAARTATGNVAPSASDGTIIRPMHESRRTAGKSRPGAPS